MRSSSLANKQSGFTLIELIVVIIILGILAVTALPKFVDLSGNARTAATQGVAGALASSSSINYANSLAQGQVAGKSSPTGTSNTVDTTPGCNTTVATNLLQSGVTFASTGTNTYSLTGSGTSPTTVGGAFSCIVTNNDDTTKTATFSLLYTK